MTVTSLKELKALLLIAFCGWIIFFIYYVTLDHRFEAVDDLYRFPVPKKAELVRETDRLKDYYWDASTGDGIPFAYRLMIRKSGWRAVDDVEGLVYEKSGYYVSFSPATDYFYISDYTTYWEMDNAKK